MPTVQHIIDQTSELAGNTSATVFKYSGSAHSQCFVNARRPMPPGSYGDIIVLYLKASWARLPFISLLRDDIAHRPLIILEQTYSRSYEQHCVADRKRFHYLLSLTYGLADLVITASEAQRSWLLDNDLTTPDKVTTCVPLHDFSELVALSVPVVRTGQPIRLVAFGGADRQSGLDILIEAMKHLPNGLATLEICCTTKDQNAIVIAASGVPSIRITTEPTGFADYLARNDAVVMPARWQPFALKAHQACAAARPLVVTNVDALAEFANKDWGEIAASDSPHDLAAAITRLAARPLPDLGAAARTAFLSRESEGHRKWSALLAGLER